jgi:hypothetical protein
VVAPIAMTRAAVGCIAGSSAPRADSRPNMDGVITVEQDLPAGTKLWLPAWSRQVADFISIALEIAANGGPRKKPTLTERSSRASFRRDRWMIKQ